MCGRSACTGYQTAPAVWFAYSQDRKGEHPRQHLKDFRGALQADAYSGFHHLYGEGAIYEVACWAHARRKFYDVNLARFAHHHRGDAAHRSPVQIERSSRQTGRHRCSVRQVRARPQLLDLKHWMEKALRSLSAKSETAAAIRYAPCL